MLKDYSMIDTAIRQTPRKSAHQNGRLVKKEA